MKKKFVQVVHRDTQQVLVQKARWCSSAGCRLVGLQFRRRLREGEGLILVYPRESTKLTSIHMFFVFMSLAAVWIDSQGRVTSVQLARPWRPYYASPEPAQYVLEGSPHLLDLLKPGDLVDFK